MATLAQPLAIRLEDYRFLTTENVRHRDTDRPGRINNSVFATYFECGRMNLLYDPYREFLTLDCEYVVRHIEIAFLKELFWPGGVVIGTRVANFDSGSVMLEQALFQDRQCAATSTSVMVMVGEDSRSPVPFSDAVLAGFEKLAA